MWADTRSIENKEEYAKATRSALVVSSWLKNMLKDFRVSCLWFHAMHGFWGIAKSRKRALYKRQMEKRVWKYQHKMTAHMKQSKGEGTINARFRWKAKNYECIKGGQQFCRCIHRPRLNSTPTTVSSVSNLPPLKLNNKKEMHWDRICLPSISRAKAGKGH